MNSYVKMRLAEIRAGVNVTRQDPPVRPPQGKTIKSARISATKLETARLKYETIIADLKPQQEGAFQAWVEATAEQNLALEELEGLKAALKSAPTHLAAHRKAVQDASKHYAKGEISIDPYKLAVSAYNEVEAWVKTTKAQVAAMKSQLLQYNAHIQNLNRMKRSIESRLADAERRLALNREQFRLIENEIGSGEAPPRRNRAKKARPEWWGSIGG